MRPVWFDINQVPLDLMWIDDYFWFPYFLRGERFNGYFRFENDECIVYQYLAAVDKDKEIEPIYEEVKTV